MRNSMQTSLGNKSSLGSNTEAITQLYKKEKHMNYLNLSNLHKWLESSITFSFRSRKSAPPPAAPKKSEAEIKADANRDRTLRNEQYAEKTATKSGKRRRRGRSLLIAKGNTEEGLSDTLG